MRRLSHQAPGKAGTLQDTDQKPAQVKPRAGPTLTIGIKAYNEAEHIDRCLTAATAIAGKLGGIVVLADSGSTDATIAIARRHDVRIVQLAKAAERSCGAGAQLAFQCAQGDYFYLIDGDMVVHDGFVEAAIACLERQPDVGAVGGRIVERHVINEEFRIRNAAAIPQDRAEEVIDRLDGGGVYRTAALRQIGHFADPNLHSFEEFELAARLREMGWRLVRLDQPAVDHFGHRMSGYTLLWRRVRSGYARGLGEVVRSAFGTRRLRVIVRDLRQVRQAAIVLLWWLSLLACAAAGAQVTLVVLVVAPLLFLTLRRRSFALGLYSYLSWNVNAFGLLAGLIHSRRDPAMPLEAIEIQARL